VLLGNRTNLAEASAEGARVQRVAADAFAANVLPVIASIKASGITSLRAIAAELNTRRVDTVRGGEWTAVQVDRIVKRAA
jgi:hypothetical protein